MSCVFCLWSLDTRSYLQIILIEAWSEGSIKVFGQAVAYSIYTVQNPDLIRYDEVTGISHYKNYSIFPPDVPFSCFPIAFHSNKRNLLLYSMIFCSLFIK